MLSGTPIFSYLEFQQRSKELLQKVT